ncbi:MAG TPA: hypothetical protein VLL76_08560 [Candidatus Omnitrophota bacterium]|nr:hypothetical protein [Candidatus Omnitrophota bacterium]
MDLDLPALLDEKKRLDDLLDEALDKFALYEEDFNNRLKHVHEDQRMAMYAERNQVEEALGIADLVMRLDELRELIAAARGVPAS